MDTNIVRKDRPDPQEEAPHGCYEGFVYIGHIVEDESGEEADAAFIAEMEEWKRREANSQA